MIISGSFAAQPLAVINVNDGALINDAVVNLTLDEFDELDVS